MTMKESKEWLGVSTKTIQNGDKTDRISVERTRQGMQRIIWMK